MIKKYVYSLIVCICILIPAPTFADGDATVTLSPKNPTPNSPVTVTLVSYIFDVNTALVTWSSNGKVLLQGVGAKKLVVQTGKAGEYIPIHVSAVTADNSTTELDITVTPESVDLLYETPESYVPLFYEGRSLPGEGAAVHFVATPTINEGGVTLPASALSYSWYKNDTFIDSASGIGKQQATLNLDTLSVFTTVKVSVSGPHGVVAEKSIDIYPHAVLPLLYTYDDIIGGNYTTLLGNRFETTKDFTLLLEPFYLSLHNHLDNSVNYSWAIDGLPVTPLGGRMLALQPKANTYGSRNLSIAISSTARRLQEANTSLDLVFDTR